MSGWKFYYKIEDGFQYMCMADDVTHRSKAFQFQDETSKEFSQNHNIIMTDSCENFKKNLMSLQVGFNISLHQADKAKLGEKYHKVDTNITEQDEFVDVEEVTYEELYGYKEGYMKDMQVRKTDRIREMTFGLDNRTVLLKRQIIFDKWVKPILIVVAIVLVIWGIFHQIYSSKSDSNEGAKEM